MFERDDEKFLKRRLGRNEVVLLLGAGFSTGATNRIGQSMPLSSDLAAELWNFLGYGGEYDGTTLADMYDAALQSGCTFAELERFLGDRR